MHNIRNYGVATGRLTRNPVFYGNRGGSQKVKFTLAVQDAFTDKEGNRGSQFLPLEAFIPASQKGNGAYGCMDKGDLVCCSYTVQNNNYKDREGNDVYGLVLQVDSVALLESRASKESRQAAREKTA